MGGFIEWDDTKEERWGKFLRLMAYMDLTRPLKRCMEVSDANGRHIRVFFKYERFLNFCCLWEIWLHNPRL